MTLDAKKRVELEAQGLVFTGGTADSGVRMAESVWVTAWVGHVFDFFVFFEQRLILTGLAWRSRICGLRGLGLGIECVTVRFVTPHPSSPPQGTVFYVFGVFGVFGGFGGFERSRVRGV